MSIYRTDDEDAIVLYHDICHVLARLDLVSVAALELLKLRLSNEATRHDDLDQHSLIIMAGLTALYITDHEEVIEDKERAKGIKDWPDEGDNPKGRKPRMGEPGWSTATDAPPGVEG